MNQSESGIFEVKMRKISDLKPAEYNPRQISDKQFLDLKKSIEKLGTLEPAVINMFPGREGVIISGHQRIRIAKEMGASDYPCHEVSFPIEKEKQANIRMNRNGGDWNFDSLSTHFDGIELLAWGFDEKDLLEAFDPKIPEMKNEAIPDSKATQKENKKKENDTGKDGSDKAQNKDGAVVTAYEKECPKCGHKWSEKANG